MKEVSVVWCGHSTKHLHASMQTRKQAIIPIRNHTNTLMHQPTNACTLTHQVPTLDIDGHSLAQSMAIINYLDETRSEVSPLFPKDAYGRAMVRQMCDIIACDIQPVQNLRVLLKHVAAGGDKMEWGKWAIENGFKGLEATLAKTAGKYCYGDDVTAADLCLVPQVYNANRFKVDMSQFPTIAAIEKNLAELEAFKQVLSCFLSID